ncbi:MAG: amino acid deaminase/aldolase [Micromonosporaceae bacterium]|nr:amino acid deaminase/aldolase [Micromonosporaceae bacterium]
MVTHSDQQRYDHATRGLDPPFAIVDLDAFRANAADLARRAGGTPIRVASKSVRCRELIVEALKQPGFSGVMGFTLPEAIWLARHGVDDVLLGYPVAHRAGIAELADPALAGAITLMVDDPAQLDLVDSALPAVRPEIQVCLDLDASWRMLGGRLHFGARRSPVHSAAQAVALARAIVARRGFALVGLMSYEGQIAGVGDAPPGRSLYGAAVRALQRGSYRELAARRAEAVDAVRRVAPLRFVNAGGTGSAELSASEPAVTEITAGSGLYGPALFDAYRNWKPRPAALFTASVVRRPAPDIATVHGGGWIASGATGKDRQPLPWLPAGLTLLGAEGAGEVQTPLRGPAAAALKVGDRVWFRHAKAGELCERVSELHLVEDDQLTGTALTYRGEGHAFL